METPISWKTIDFERKKIYQSFDNDKFTLIEAYEAKYNESSIPVVFYDYTNAGVSFVETLDNALNDIEDTNKLIDGDVLNPEYTNTSMNTPIFHSIVEIKQTKCYVSVQKNIAYKTFVYSVQIFKTTPNGLFCGQTLLPSFDESNVMMSLDNQHIKDIVDCLSQL